MKKGLSQILSDGRGLRISIVEKESDMGLTYNERLLVLREGDCFGYISKFLPSEKPEDVDFSKCKERALTKHITSVTREKSTLRLKFYKV